MKLEGWIQWLDRSGSVKWYGCICKTNYYTFNHWGKNSDRYYPKAFELLSKKSNAKFKLELVYA